jgi:aminomethyltransferase
MAQNIKNLPLSERHLKLSAKMADFAGWQVPLFYTSIISEYHHCREHAVIFDISHMGEFIFEGDIGESGIEEAITPQVKKTAPGRSRYGFILNASGGVIDDLVIFKISENKLMLVVNAARRHIDYKILKQRLKKGNLLDVSEATVKIDLQGPQARDALAETLGFRPELSYFRFSEFDYQQDKILISRTGYTGELGYEIFMPNHLATTIWDKLVNNKLVEPAGFGARDILRLEMGYSLWGHELSEQITPLQAGLNKLIHFDKNFSGRQALLRQRDRGIDKIKIALRAHSRRIPRDGDKIYIHDRELGVITSGAFSPALNSGIALGYVENGFNKVGTEITIVDNKQRRHTGEIVKLPFYKHSSLRK